MTFETNRINNITKKITIPVNIIAIFIPKGLNQEPFGGFINSDPNATDTIILMVFAKIISLSLTFIDKSPAKIANNNAPVNKKVGLFGT